MSKTFTTQAASIFAAAIMTFAVFTGTGLVAGHQAELAASSALDAPVQLAMQVQHVTIVGHRTPA